MFIPTKNKTLILSFTFCLFFTQTALSVPLIPAAIIGAYSYAYSTVLYCLGKRHNELEVQKQDLEKKINFTSTAQTAQGKKADQQALKKIKEHVEREQRWTMSACIMTSFILGWEVTPKIIELFKK